jgi:hypothetical protein
MVYDPVREFEHTPPEDLEWIVKEVAKLRSGVPLVELYAWEGW